MMNLIKLYNEIKISNPYDNFFVTKKGREDSKWFNQFWVAARNLDCQDMLFEIDDIDKKYPYLWDLANLNMLSDLYGEGIIFMENKNNINEVIQKYTNRIGDENSIIIILKKLQKHTYITKIRI